jgi:L-serine dehydratase, iron-sulfur-dependent, beta subunit
MYIFDVMGPVMVGPSSSHTAGAVRIGNVTGKLLGEQPVSAEILLHGSFAATGVGHGTHKALVAGLLGLLPDNIQIPNSFNLAEKAGLKITMGTVVLRNAHPNTALLRVTGSGGRKLEVIASSIGGGKIMVVGIDGIEVNFSGDFPTLVIRNQDTPGHVFAITGMLSRRGINIATVQLYRNRRGGYAIMVIECDERISAESIRELEKTDGVIKVTYLDTGKDGDISA